MKQCPTVSDAALYSHSDPSGDVRAQRYTPRVSGSLLTSLTSSSPSDCCSLLERGHNHLTHTDRETDRHVEYAAHVWTCCQSVCVSTCWLYCSVYYCPLQTDSLSLRLSVQPAEIWTAEPSEDKQRLAEEGFTTGSSGRRENPGKVPTAAYKSPDTANASVAK